MTNDTDTFALPSDEINELQQEFPMVDPVQVEKELTDQYIEMQKNMQPADVAAHFFQMFYPKYKQLLSGLSNKDARRVAEHVVQWPLHDSDPKFNDENAKQAFQVGVRLLDCKFIMKSVVEMERLANAEINKANAEKQNTETPVEQPAVEPATGDVTNG